MSLLLPDGIRSLHEIPFTLFDAIEKALTFLHYQEEFSSDERPPRSIWLQPRALNRHWREVEREREAKYDPSKRGIQDEPIEGPVSHNDVEGLLGIKR